MDFNIYLTIKPEEWEVTSNNQIIIKKRLPSKLNLHNYKVALIYFTSNFKNPLISWHKFQIFYTKPQISSLLLSLLIRLVMTNHI